MGLALAGGLALMELILRARHRRAEQQAEEGGLQAQTRRLTPAELDGRLRIVALGDSITHGFILPAEQAYPALLEAHLRGACPGRDLTVINAGICGHTAVQGYLRLERDVLRFLPALTLIAFGLNDAALGRSALDVRREAEAFPAGWNAALGRLHLIRALRARARRWGLTRRPIDDDWPDDPRTTPAAFRAALAGMTRRIGRQGGRVLFLTTHPTAWEGAQARRLAEYNEITRQVAAVGDAGLLDVERAFAGVSMAELLDGDGVHLTLAGQRALADVIAAGVLAELWARPTFYRLDMPATA